MKHRTIRFAFPLCSLSTGVVHIFKTFEEDEVGHLLNSGYRIGDSAGPEAVPECVDFTF